MQRSVLPEPPAVKVMEVKDNTFSLVWTPGLEGDSPITGFILEYKAVNGKTFISASTCETFTLNLFTLNLSFSHTASWDSTKTVVEFGPNQTDATILEVKPSTYNLRIFARNRLGTSKASNVLTITTTDTGARISNCLL